jgi:competence protein ComEC
VTEQRPQTTVAVLAVTAIETREGWAPASGCARLTVECELRGLHRGDLLELTGRLSKPRGAANPGELDFRSRLLDDRITAVVRVEKSAATVTRLEEGWRASLLGWLGVLRGWGTRSLQEALSPDESGLAGALLLGDPAAFDRDGWDRYVRTGVVHVLAISGQHLVILAAFAWFVLKVFGVRRRHGAWGVAAVMIAYTLLTGARPSAVRAAVMVSAVCAAILLRRRVMAANIFALAWLVVIILNPTDPFTSGCQLSFLSVFVLVWGAGIWLAPQPPTPAEQLIEESRTLGVKAVRGLLRGIGVMFAISLILGVANAPLILAWNNMVSPVGVLLTPPLVFLTTIALIAGFLLLFLSPLGWLAWPLARVTEWSLAGCEALVHGGERIPGAWVYSPAPPVWWLVGFYLGVAALVLVPSWSRRSLLLLAVWMFAGLALSSQPRTSDECRFTFLAIGHGGCVVIETPDGRVILYDAGTTTGPDAVRRTIAPFLWSRGVSRVDEVFVSHADLDHFNGLPELLKRFAVGRVTLTPSFSEKNTPGVEAALAALGRRGVAVRVAVVGERFEAGGVAIDVLHPPAEGPGPRENENVRSMVLLVRYRNARVLLTGDIEREGQAVLCERALPPVDVMLAPHHGAKTANGPQRLQEGETQPRQMATWARPRLVISSQRPGPTDHLKAAYGSVGATVWDTPTAGAVIVRCHATGVVVEAFRSGEVLVVSRGK